MTWIKKTLITLAIILVFTLTFLAIFNSIYKFTEGVSIRKDGSVYFRGILTHDSVQEIKQALIKASTKKLTIQSAGGNSTAGLALGNFIFDNKIDIEVSRYCASACANFIFLAGDSKVLSKDALVMFHGGASQANSLQQILNVLDGIESQHKGKESHFPIDVISRTGKISAKLPPCHFPSRQILDSDLYVKSFGDKFNTTLAERCVDWRIKEEKIFFDKIGVDRGLLTYGQIGDYLSIYQSYDYDGFYYSLEDLRLAGVSNLSVKNGVEWQPEENRRFSSHYKVVISVKQND